MAGRKLTALPSLAGKPADGDKFYVVDVSDTSESPQGTSKEVTYEELEIPTSGTATITPVVTAGTGSATDFTIYFYRIGNLVHFDFYCRTFTIVIGEGLTTVTVDLTGTGFEPSSDFSFSYDVIGIASAALSSSGNDLASAFVQAGTGKKLSLGLATTANVSVSDYSSALVGSGSYSI